MTSQTPTVGLLALSDTDLKLDEAEQDIRGRTLADPHGQEIGEIKDLLVDTQERQVRFMVVGVGGFFGLGEKNVMVPVDAIASIDDHMVHVKEDGESVAGGPDYNPNLLLDREYHRDVYDWYGYPGFWTAGYTYPMYWRRTI